MKAVGKKKLQHTSSAKIGRKRDHTRRTSIFFLIVALLLAIIIVIGNNLPNRNESSNPPVAESSNLSPLCQYHDPDLCEFVNNWRAQRDYSVSTTAFRDGVVSETLYEISRSGDKHMLVKENGKEISQSIVIGNAMYDYDYLTNTWEKHVLSPDRLINSPEDQIKDEVLHGTDATTKFIFVTKEPCGDTICLKYRIDVPQSNMKTQYIWFDNQNYLVRKFKIQDSTGNTNRSMYYYGGITINAPYLAIESSPAPRE